MIFDHRDIVYVFATLIIRVSLFRNIAPKIESFTRTEQKSTTHFLQLINQHWVGTGHSIKHRLSSQKMSKWMQTTISYTDAKMTVSWSRICIHIFVSVICMACILRWVIMYRYPTMRNDNYLKWSWAISPVRVHN